MTGETAFIQDFAWQVPNWLVLVILIAVVFGAWKLVQLLMAAIHN